METTQIKHGKTLEKPLTDAEQKKMMDEKGNIQATTAMDMGDFYKDFELFLDLVSETVTGSCCMIDINVTPVAVDQETRAIILEVTGEVDIIE